jgi:hypothetical protein
MPTAVIPDLPVSNIGFSMEVVKDLEAKLRAKYNYGLSQYKEANENLLKIVEEKASKEKHQLELHNLTTLQEKHQLLQEKCQLEVNNCSCLSENKRLIGEKDLILQERQ